jgi:hypothetical protein
MHRSTETKPRSIETKKGKELGQEIKTRKRDREGDRPPIATENPHTHSIEEAKRQNNPSDRYKEGG